MRRLLGLLLLLGAAPLLARAEPAPAPPPRLRLLAPLGGQTRERVVTIRGEAQGIKAERLTLVLNGVPLSIPRSEAGFETQQVLAPGRNSIRVVAEEGGQLLEDSVTVFARVPAKDLRVTLTWDTPATDVDLWVTGPDAEKVFYSHRQGALGGTLDTDVTTGFGPETFTLARLSAGAWRIQAHYYGGAAPTWVEVTVVEHEGEPQETRRVFRGLLLAVGDVLEVGEIAVSR